jgi:WD40 repeat protein
MGSVLGKTQGKQDVDVVKGHALGNHSGINGRAAISRRPCHQGEVLDVTAVEDACVLTAGGDSVAKVWRLLDRQADKSFESHQKAVLKVNYSEQLESGFSSSRDANVFMWPISRTMDSFSAFEGHSLAVTGLALSCDATKLATGSRDNSVRTWDIRTGLSVATETISRNIVTHMCWLPSNMNEFVQTSEDKAVKLWDSRTMKVVQQFPTQRHIHLHCSASNDDHSILTSSSGLNGNGCNATLWDKRQGGITQEFHHQSAVNSAIFLRKDFSECIASCSSDCTVKMWNVKSGDCLVSEYVDGARALTSLCMAGNKYLVCGSQRRGVNIFEMDRTDVGNYTLNFIGDL